MSNANAVTPIRSDRFPGGIPFIVGNEGAERFSFYGMKAILYVYLTALILMFKDQTQLAPDAVAAAKASATAINHYFIAAVYAFPMVGAALADRLLGKYPVIMWVSALYTLGHGLLAVGGRLAEMGNFGAGKSFFFAGLALIAIGSGGIKPCVSANVGDQFDASNGHLLPKVYQIFYFMINFGSFFSTIITPILYKTVGAEWAFGVPGILMAIATFVFWLGRKKFVRVAPVPGGKLGLMDTVATILLVSPILAIIMINIFAHRETKSYTELILLWLGVSAPLFIGGLLVASWRWSIKEDNGFLAVVWHCFKNPNGKGFFAPAYEKWPTDIAEGPAAVLRIALVFSMAIIFWSLFDQHSSTWVEQANQMNLKLTMPFYVWYSILGAGILASLFGGVALMLYVGNKGLSSMGYIIGLVVVGLGALGAPQMGMWLENIKAISESNLHIAGSVRELASLIDVEISGSQVSALNPIFVMMIIPMLNAFVYGPMDKRGTPLKPLVRMGIGMGLAGFAFMSAALMQASIESLAVSGQKVHVLWQSVQYFIMTIAEVMVSVTGLEFAYTQAPRRMKSTISALWLLCVALANILVALLAPLEKSWALSEFFWLFTGMMFIATAVFAVIAYFYKGKTYLQDTAGNH